MKRRKLQVAALAAALFVISTAVPRPFTREFQCMDNADRGQYVMRRSEHGLPVPIIKRSTSDFDCKPSDGKGFGGEKRSKVDTILWLNPDHAHEQYAYGYVIVSSIFVNAAFWAIFAYLVLNRRRQTINSF